MIISWISPLTSNSFWLLSIPSLVDWFVFYRSLQLRWYAFKLTYSSVWTDIESPIGCYTSTISLDERPLPGMHHEGVCKPSFPVEKMSIDDLEHVALSPHRFADYLRGSDGRRITPFQTRVLHPRDVDGVISGGVFLVPGGPFLVKSSFNTHYLWNLEATANSPMKPFPVAKLSTKVLA